MKKIRSFNKMRILPIIALALFTIHYSLFTISCARMGQPDGGWYDDDPPQVVGSTPEDRATHINTKIINIFFDEFIKIDNPSEKVIVSPPQLEMPEIKASGKKIVVELKDTLKENTTYTISAMLLQTTMRTILWVIIPSPSQQVSRLIPSK